MRTVQVEKDNKDKKRAKIHSFYLFHSFLVLCYYYFFFFKFCHPPFCSLIYGPYCSFFLVFCFPLNKDYEGDFS